MVGRVRCVVEECGALCVSLKSLVNHVRSNHSLSRKIKLPCPVRLCSAKFLSAESFRKHIEWRHKSELKHDASIADAPFQINLTSVSEPEGGCSESVEGNVVSMNAETVFNNLMGRVERETVKLRLLLEHHFDLPNSTASRIYDEVMSFTCGLQRQFNEAAMLRLSEVQVDDSLLSLMLQCPELEKVCKATKGDLSKLVKSVGFVEPVEIDLIELSGEDIPLLPGVKRPTMQYVPILATLQSYLSHEDVLRAVLREDFVTDPEVLTDFSSGSIFKEHPLFSENPHSLRIILYTDELELCNPLGGNTVKHKVCAVYFQLGNIGTKFLSSQDSIHLALLVKWEHVKKFSYAVVLKPLLQDLTVLANEGIQVSVKGGGVEHFRGAVAFLCADNLSMHAVGGFQGHFNTGKVCRFCLTDYTDLSLKSHVGLCVQRTPEMHASHISMVKEDSELASVYGVTSVSVAAGIPFLKVPYCLPPDIMHDILEKVMCLNVKIVLKGLNLTVQRSKALSYSKVTRILSNFKLGLADRVNKPPDLPVLLMRKRAMVRGSASQKWGRFYTLSLALGPHVPVGNKYWKLHLLLNKIVDIVFAFTISKGMIRELKLLLREHHKLWVSLVAGCYPPKLHYLHHYADMILMCGPLRHCWVMRFESFHLFLKRMCQKSNNFINIEKTLSNRVQLKRCVLLSGENALPPDIVIRVSQKSLAPEDLPSEVSRRFGEECPQSAVSSVVEVSAVTVSGLLVKRGCFNVLNVVDGRPSFLLASRIFVVNDQVLVLGRQAVSVAFDCQLHAHHIQLPNDSEDMVCVHSAQISPGQTLSAYSINNKSYIKLRFTPL